MRRGQLQSLEPIMVIVIIAIIAVIGVVFFSRLTTTQNEFEEDRIERLQAIGVLKVATTMPELSCAKSVTSDTYCIDLYKALAFSEIMNTSEKIFYQPLFGTSRVTLTFISLSDGELSKIVLYDLVANNSNTRGSMTHFTIYDPITNEKKLARLLVEQET